MWIFEKIKTDLDDFVGPYETSSTLILNLKCSRQTTTEILAGFKTSQWEKQISTILSDCGISWSLQQKTLFARKTCRWCWYQQCPKTWMNNSNRLTRWLMKLTEQIERFVWFCCRTLWKSQKVQMIKSEQLQRRRRTRTFNQLWMWTINMKHSSTYLM